MAKPLFKVSVVGVWEIHDMPGTWSDDDYRKLLAQLEVEDTVSSFESSAYDDREPREVKHG